MTEIEFHGETVIITSNVYAQGFFISWLIESLSCICILRTDTKLNMLDFSLSNQDPVVGI